MKVLGIVGGIAPQSTIEYYRSIIASYRAQRPDGSYPPLIINSIDLKRVLDLVAKNDLARLTEYLLEEIHKLACAGAQFGLLASNTPHIVFEALQGESPIPLISIVEATCQEAKSLGLKKVGLFGTQFTMRGQFYPQVFSRAGIEVIVPAMEDQAYIHNKYVNELIPGVFLPETREGLLAIVNRMKESGIQAVILGGTELSFILRVTEWSEVLFLDTSKIHVQRAVAEMLS
jgi:aspartate racemase